MKDLNWRLILATAGILGVIGGVLPIFLGAQLLYSTMPIVMLISVYFLVPRVKESSQRLQTGVTASALSAVIAMTIYFIYQYATLDAALATSNLKAAIGQFFMLVLVISVGGAWFFVKIHEWAEKKREEMDARQQSRGGRVARRMGAAEDGQPKKKFSQMSMQEKFKKKQAEEENAKK